MIDLLELGRRSCYYVKPHYKKPSKTYENKNRNIEY